MINRKTLSGISLLLLLLFIISISFPASAESSILQAGTPTLLLDSQAGTPALLGGSLAQDEEGATPAKESIYTPYLKGEKKLDVYMGQAFFDTVIEYIKRDFVREIQISELQLAAKDEIRELLETAGIETTTLSHITANKDLITRVFKAYDSKIDRSLLVYAAINGAFKALKDPYSHFFTREQMEEWDKILTEEYKYVGIGIFTYSDKNNNNRLTVLRLIPAGPALMGGLREGDVITEINGESIEGLSYDEASLKFKGPEGSKLSLKVTRKGSDSPLFFSINRENIQMKDIYIKVIDEKIGYIKLEAFSEAVYKEMKENLDALKEKGVKGIILDLRNNPGGYVEVARILCDQFLGAGQSVIRVESRGIEVENLQTGYGSDFSLPMVVLINQYSASASEITSACLKDHETAYLIGTKSFGKGCIQQVFDLAGGAGLKLTVANFMSPLRNPIDKVGVMPHKVVEMDADLVGTQKDVQFREAVEYLKSKIMEKE